MSATPKSVLPTLAGCLLALCACSGSPGPTVPSAPTPAPSASPAARTTPAPPPAATTPSEPTKAAELAMVRRAVMSTATLGRPWVQPKAVATTKGKAAEACPGQPSIQSLAPVRVGAVTSFTRGRARGASIARFSVQTVSDQGVAFHAAWYRTAKACAAFRDSSKFYVVTSAEGPTRLAGTDDVVSRTERIYYDAKHHHLAYARHFITARTGRALSSVEYDFLTSKSDPQAKDFSTAQHLLTLQLTRTRSVFSS